MIRLIFGVSISISLLHFTLAAAQEKQAAPESQKFSIGIKAGPNVTLALYPDKAQRDQFTSYPKLGFGGSAFINFPLKKDYSYLAEAGYAIKGRRTKLTNGDFFNTQTFHFAEVAMALRKSFNLRLVKNIPSKWFINIGPNIGYWISGSGKFVETKYDIKFDLPPDGNLYVNYLSNINRWLFGIDVGIGADAPINRRQKVRLELRATFGQTYLGKKNSGSSYATLSWEDTLKTNLTSLSFTAAYTLDFDRRAMKMGKSTKNKEIKKKKR